MALSDSLKEKLGKTEKPNKNILQSKKGMSAIAGGTVGLLATILSPEFFPEGSPWWAPILASFVVVVPCVFQIVMQGIQDCFSTYGEVQIQIARVNKANSLEELDNKSGHNG